MPNVQLSRNNTARLNNITTRLMALATGLWRVTINIDMFIFSYCFHGGTIAAMHAGSDFIFLCHLQVLSF